MYLQAANEKLVLSLASAKATNDCPIVFDINDHDADGMVTPQTAGATTTNGITEVEIASGSASLNRQIPRLTLFNIDTARIVATFYKKVAGTNYGLIQAILEPGETLVYSKDGVWSIFNRAQQRRTVLRSVTANETYEPEDFSFLFAAGVGGGGGAGSGRRGAAASNRFGGGGAGGAALVYRFFTRAELPDSIAITIGTGGPGAAGVLVDDTNGAAGTAGVDTKLGAAMVCKGGGAGGAGSTATGAAGPGGAAASCTPGYGPFSLAGSAGGAGQTTTNSAGGNGLNGSTACPGGGGGGGISNTNVSGTAANTGGSVYQNGILVAGPVSGASPNGGDNKSLVVFPSQTLTPLTGIGTGGAGGTPATPNGGNGGLYGAGGGGGAGVLNGTTSGKGGDGAQGAMWLLELYA